MNAWSVRTAAPLALLLALAVGACSDPAPTEPDPLDHVHLGSVPGITAATVEAACLSTALPSPAIDWYYVIDVLPRSVTYSYSGPWPGRGQGDVHAAEHRTDGPARFSCTPRSRSGSTNAAIEVTVGGSAEPVFVAADVKVCAGDGQGGSAATAQNRGGFTCPHAFGAIFPPVTTIYANPGTFATTMEVVGPTCTVYRPATLGENGRRHPIILWANGITLNHTFYSGFLTHLATHGFLVAAADTARVGSAGNGQDLLACLGYLEGQNGPGGRYENKLNLYRVGAAGHSAGGAGVLMAGRDERIAATAPVQPWVGATHGYVAGAVGLAKGPIFLSSGSADTEIPAGHHPAIWNAATVPIFWGTIQASGHDEPLFSGGRYRGPVTAWFRWMLMLDTNPAALFAGANCILCQSADWVVQRKNGL